MHNFFSRSYRPSFLYNKAKSQCMKICWITHNNDSCTSFRKLNATYLLCLGAYCAQIAAITCQTHDINSVSNLTVSKHNEQIK